MQLGQFSTVWQQGSVNILDLTADYFDESKMKKDEDEEVWIGEDEEEWIGEDTCSRTPEDALKAHTQEESTSGYSLCSKSMQSLVGWYPGNPYDYRESYHALNLEQWCDTAQGC